MTPLHRHQIAWLSRAGWGHLLDGSWDAEARGCLKHWAQRSLPVVVTRQPDDDGAQLIAMGLCAPRRWRYRRLVLRVPQADVLYFDEFARLEQLVTRLPVGARAPARLLSTALQACGATARVYGSHGWQHLTGLEHVRDGSDLDVWVGVSGVEQADAVAAALNAFAAPTRRLDGELVFPGDTAVAWREWLAWRAGCTQAVLTKRLLGAAMSSSLEAFGLCEVLA